MVSLVNSNTHATSKRWHLLEIDLRFALNSTPGWRCGRVWARARYCRRSAAGCGKGEPANQTDRQIDEYTDRQTDRQSDRQIDRHRDRQTDTVVGSVMERASRSTRTHVVSDNCNPTNTVSFTTFPTTTAQSGSPIPRVDDFDVPRPKRR